MKVLVGCEFSGTVREAFRARGHDAWSCDLLPSGDGSAFHLQGDVLEAIADRAWDLAVFHPPCTYLSVSGMHWTARGLRDPQLTEVALEFVRKLLAADIPLICLENPITIISTRIRKPEQIVQPWMFGDDASKATCLWLKGLPPLAHYPRDYVEPRIVGGKRRWANQTDSGQNRLPPSADRWARRSLTYPGLARAMASQWGG